MTHQTILIAEMAARDAMTFSDFQPLAGADDEMPADENELVRRMCDL